MTLEDFAHRCLMIKAGNAELAIPCCANCEHYTEVITGQEVRGNVITGFKLINTSTEWLCLHPEIDSDDSAFCWVAMKPEDFCSRWEERNEVIKKNTKIEFKDLKPGDCFYDEANDSHSLEMKIDSSQDDKWVQCSNCKDGLAGISITGFKYCPFCGAELTGIENEK